jgi:hypothetical protein
MKLLVIGFLIFLGYRLIMPASTVEAIDERDSQDLTEGEFTDYEEVKD